MHIKVMGTGCRKCKALLAATEEAVKSSGVQAEIEYVTDMIKIAETGLMSTPGLIKACFALRQASSKYAFMVLASAPK